MAKGEINGWQAKKKRVYSLHLAGTSHPAIAKQEGVTVDMVRKWIGEFDLGEVATSRKATRCPDCGALVLMPCMACKVNYLKSLG